MTTNDDQTDRMIEWTARAMAEASARRIAATPAFVLPDKPADRSRNGRRNRNSSRKHRFIL